MSIRELRLGAALSQQQLADAAGINRRQIQKIEAGEISIENVTLKNAAALAQALGVNIEDLLK